MISGVTAALLFSVALNLKSANAILDYLIPFYFAIAIALGYIIITAKSPKINENREYVYERVRKDVWKENFQGKWDGIEKYGFYEFLVFNGAPTFIASVAKNKKSTSVIQVKGKNLIIDATGLSPHEVVTGESRETAVPFVMYNAVGSRMVLKYWWDATTESLCSVTETDAQEAVAVRTIIDEEHMVVINTATKKNGDTCQMKSVSKRAR